MSFFSFFSIRRTRSPKARARRLTLRVEMLEDRCTPSNVQTLVETATFPVAVTPTPTNFSLAGTVQQFDPSQGVLQSVVITEQGTVNSTIGVENTSTSSASQITATVSGKLEVTGPGVDLVVTPSDNLATFNATTFDGTVDFAGTSGKTYPTASAGGTQSLTLNGAAMAPFISSVTGQATGTVALTEVGQGTSSASGTGGNLQVTTTNTASAVVTVTYNYLPLSSLAGYVYWDMGSGAGTAGYNDGIFESNESGIAGVTVQLTGTDYRGNAVSLTANTGVGGAYSFANLQPGTYTLSKSAGVPGDPGAIDGKDTIGTQGGTVAENLFSNINLQAGVAGVNNDFAELMPSPPPPPPPPLPSSLSGYVYYDTGTSGPGSPGYNDGIKEAGEQGISGTYVYLVGSTSQGAVYTYRTTDANGYYNFANLQPGAYAIIKGAVPNANAIDGKDTIGTQGGKTIENEFYNIGLAGGVNGINNNFGELLPEVVGGDFPDVSIVKTANPSQVLIGGTLTYTLTVANVGTGNAAGLTVTDVLPNGTAVYNMAGAGWTLALSGQTVTATLPALAEGAQSVITISVYAPPTPGNITNTATLTETSPDSDLNDKKSSVTTPVIAPPVVPFPPAVFAIPSGTFSKSQLLGNGGSIGNLNPTIQGQLVYVESLYRTLYGQPSNPGGLINFVQQLNHGVSPAQIVQQFWTSNQQRANEVAYYFQVYYHRAPTAAETTAWTSTFDAGYSDMIVQWMLVTSTEYNADHPTDASFVNGLFLDALGRAATVTDETYWQSFIAAHGRAAAAYAILHSNEYFGHQVDLVYNAWFNRAPSPTDRAIWVGLLQSNQMGLGNVYVSLLSSQEFANLAVKQTGVA